MREELGIIPTMDEDFNSRPQASLVRIDDNHAGQRIDNFLMTRLKGVPKSHVYRILRTGQVRLNGGRIPAGRRLVAGDVVRMPPLRTGLHEHAVLPLAEGFRRRLESSILLEDSEILVINKPARIAVHGGSGLALGIIEGLRRARGEEKFLELVHRLDRDTSGCLVIAKKRSALRCLHQQFRENQVGKEYLALLDGHWKETSRTIAVALEKNVLQSGERLVKASDQGKAAVTRFRRRHSYREWTLVEAEPETGRTHQIRVHAQCLGYPIAGDERYGSPERLREAHRIGLRRLFLHASRVSFAHPATGQRLSLEAPLDPELQQFLTALR